MALMDNRKARFDYEIIQTLEAGVVLHGWEVKSLRAGNGNMKSGWIKIKDGEAWLQNVKITPWHFGTVGEQDQNREKKILMHKKELLKFETQIQEKKITLVPLKIYLKKGLIKCEVGVGKGRKGYEKRQVLKERSMNREAQKAMKQY